MEKKGQKIAAYFIIGAMSFAGNSFITHAEELPVAGIGVVLDEFYQSNTGLEADFTEYLNPIVSEYQDMAISKVSNYVNIRSNATEDGKVLGKLYSDSAALVLATEGDWYQIKSGTVTGYVKAEYMVVGEEVETLAKTVGDRMATVNTKTLKVRDKASLDATVQTLVPLGEEFDVLKENDKWVKIAIDTDVVGYVSAEYVDLKTEFLEAESIEEEVARLEAVRVEEEKAEQDRLEEVAQEAADQDKAAQEASRNRATNKVTEKKSSTREASETEQSVKSSSSSSRQEIVNYALKFVGNPYVWGGTSLTNGVDCSGFTQAVFRNMGIGISRTSRTQANGGRTVSTSSMKPGDLIFYDNSGTINHVGIYIGNGKVISASSEKTGVRISNYQYRQPCKVVSYID